MGSQITEVVIKAVFDDANKDASGKVSVEDLEQMMQTLGQTARKHEIRDLVKENANGNDSVSYVEFLKMVAMHVRNIEQYGHFRQSFRKFDVDGNGYLRAKEIKSVMIDMGVKLTDKEVDDMLNRSDANDEEKINYIEFAKMMSS